MNFSNAGIDEVRDKLDLFSYNVRLTFYGHTHDVAENKNFSADVLESLIKSAASLTELLDKMTAWEIQESKLPKLNGILLLLNAVTNEIEEIGELFREKVTEEYFALFQNKIEDLKEVIEDVENVFFTYPNDPSFTQANRKLSLIK